MSLARVLCGGLNVKSYQQRFSNFIFKLLKQEIH